MTCAMRDLRQLLMGAITAAVVCVASGCGGDTPHDAPTTPVRTTAFVDPTPVSAGTQLYDGQAFAITYPGGWWVHNAEEPASFGTATTIVDPTNHARSVRVEVRARAHDRATIERGPGYRLLDRSRLTFEGHRALLREYVVDQDGRSLHKQALSFTDDGGRGITIVTQAPQRDYAAWAKTFAATRGSYLPN
jgi:hypothetical protein